MADSRFPTQFHIDFCFNPVRISKNGRTYFVPCGKCDGCRLHKANEWSFRVGDEIENNPFSIFFTLTYSNKYVPKVRQYYEDDQGVKYYRSAANDIRFNGKSDVFRIPLEFESKFSNFAPLTNYEDKTVFGVCRKDDIQLWLKLIRKDLYDYFDISRSSFRYFIVSEYGPGKSSSSGRYRPHFHGIIFPRDEQIAELLLYPSKEIQKFQESGLLYSNWQMCDRGLFEQYTKYCNSGARHYVTQYISSTTSLPPLYKHEIIKPFRLASKSFSAIGFSYFDKQEVSKEIERGVIDYIKRVPDCERTYIFRYSSALINTIFPKCSRYNQLDYFGLLRVYGFLRFFRKFNRSAFSPSFGLRENEFRSGYSDYSCALTCDKICELNGWSVFHYVDVLQNYYYLRSQDALKYQYEWQESHISDKFLCISWYSNFVDFFKDVCDINSFKVNKPFHYDVVLAFLSSFGLVYSST